MLQGPNNTPKLYRRIIQRDVFGLPISPAVIYYLLHVFRCGYSLVPSGIYEKSFPNNPKYSLPVYTHPHTGDIKLSDHNGRSLKR